VFIPLIPFGMFEVLAFYFTGARLNVAALSFLFFSLPFTASAFRTDLCAMPKVDGVR